MARVQGGQCPKLRSRGEGAGAQSTQRSLALFQGQWRASEEFVNWAGTGPDSLSKQLLCVVWRDQVVVGPEQKQGDWLVRRHWSSPGRVDEGFSKAGGSGALRKKGGVNLQILKER